MGFDARIRPFGPDFGVEVHGGKNAPSRRRGHGAAAEASEGAPQALDGDGAMVPAHGAEV